ncbi:MAG: hypothetical protein K9M99_02325 [Candidatus Cloacimonetes bacterium]|nr:hypothetical protein [Candidatus Cloacimonadota bacterium]
MKIRVLLVISIFCFINNLCSESGYYTPQNIHSFAEHLFQEGDYLRAAGEYERYLYLKENTDAAILYKIALCYELSHQPDKAVRYFNKIIQESQQPELITASHYQIAHVFYFTHKYQQSNQYLLNHSQQFSSPKNRQKAELLQGVNLLYQKDWKNAGNIFSSLASPERPKIQQLNTLSLSGSQLKYKKPAIAGCLSAIIPGTGKFYSGRISDGLYSFITITLSAWQAYEGFSDDGEQSLKGWIYGGLGTVFYLGNIYGSVVSVKLYNNKLDEKILDQVNIDLIWTIE